MLQTENFQYSAFYKFLTLFYSSIIKPSYYKQKYCKTKSHVHTSYIYIISTNYFIRIFIRNAMDGRYSRVICIQILQLPAFLRCYRYNDASTLDQLAIKSVSECAMPTIFQLSRRFINSFATSIDD